jgi:isopenicillin N synthase-like dioxygenase
MPTLPILSLTSPTLPADLYTACKDTGFFYLTDHGIPHELLDSVLSLSRRFFLEASDEEKSAIRRKTVEEGGDGARGYQVVGENVTKGQRDYHEAVDFYREWNQDTEQKGYTATKFLQGPNLWPSHPPELKQVLEEYTKQCQVVGTRIVKAMGEALGEGSVFVNATRDSFWVMRMIGYPPLTTPSSEGISCGEHTDYGCVTLLLADSTPDALQVQSHDGGTWITANPIPGAFVVNIGDMIERWTNGEWRSTNHRVVHRGENFRVSVPFFFEPDFQAVVEPLGECVRRTGGVRRFESVVYGEHLVGKVSAHFILPVIS